MLELEEDFQFNDSQIHYLFINFKGEFKHRDLTNVLSIVTLIYLEQQ